MLSAGKTPGGRQRWRCGGDRNSSPYCYSTTSPEGALRDQRGNVKTPAKPPVFHQKLTAKRYLITAAQNATPVHAGFLKSLEIYARENKAKLIVIPIRYKNPTSNWTASQANEEVWVDEVVPYLCNERLRLNKNLVVLGDVKTQPTASSPLTGYEGLTQGESGILGHTKLQFKTIATPQHRYPKVMTTTGAVTVANYTDTKAGKLGAFHHTLGATVVELDGSKFHLRQINADKAGSFYDLDRLYTPEGVSRGHRAESITFGDTHVGFVDPKVEKATFGTGGIVDTLNPKYLVFHDLHDGYSCNPHHAGNPFLNIAKHRGNRHLVREEVKAAVDYVVKRTRGDRRSIIVPSNHDDFLARWLRSTDWRLDPDNAEFYLETALQIVRESYMGDGGSEYPDAFIYWIRKLTEKSDKKIRALNRDESFTLCGVEHGMHSDRGPNGARGSIKNLKRIGVRSTVGHSHSPGIDEGCCQGGTSTRLRLEYNGGPSSWLNTHVVLYPNGKRSLISIIDGDWRA
jgi:hypothetical protein